MMLIETKGHRILILDRSYLITRVKQAIELMSFAMNIPGSSAMVIYSESLPGDFFDLKTCLAGEMLQKFSLYGMRLAIVGSFEGYNSSVLQAFIRECNRGRLVFWKRSLKDALEVLCQDQGLAY